MIQGSWRRRAAVSALLGVWIAFSYLTAFFTCFKGFAYGFYFEPPADGVGQYLFFSRDPAVDSALHWAFKPLVGLSEDAGWLLYAPSVFPEFYEAAAAGEPLGAYVGWHYATLAGGLLRYVAIGVACSEMLTTGLLAYLVWRHWRARDGRQRGQACSPGDPRDAPP